MTKAEMLIFPFMQHTDHTMRSLSLLSCFYEIYLNYFWPHKHYIQTLIEIKIYNPDFSFFFFLTTTTAPNPSNNCDILWIKDS